MKKQNQTSCAEEFNAQIAIRQIQKWIEKKYPRVAASDKTRMIMECLIELTEERMLLSSQG